MAARANIRSEISVDTSKFSAAMRRAPMIANSAMNKVGAAVGKVTASVARMTAATAKWGAILLSVAAGAGMAAFLKGLKSAADMGGKLADLSARTGIAVKELVLLRQAFADNGIEADKVGAVINKMQKTIVDLGDGSKPLEETFGRLGLRFSELRNQSPAQQFSAIQRSLAAIQDPAMRAALAMQIFGRAGGELNTLFADAGAMGSAAKAVGNQALILEANAQTFDRISDILSQIPAKFQGFFVGVLQPLAAPLLELLEKFAATDFSGAGQAFGAKLTPLLDSFKGWIDLIQTQLGSGASVWTVVSDELELAALKFADTFKTGIVDALGEIRKAWDQSVGDKVSDTVVATAGLATLIATGGDKNAAAAKIASMGGFSSDLSPDKKTSRMDDLMARRADRLTAGKAAADAAFAAKIASGASYGNGQFSAGYKPLSTIDPSISTLPHMAGFSPITAAGKPAFGPQNRPGAGGGISQMARGLIHSQQAAGHRAAGFGGLAGWHDMQRDKAFGIGPGANGIFAQDRARLGIKSGLSTGGLGAARRVGREKDEEAMKRQAELQKSANEHLIEIKEKISESLSVN